MPSEILISGFGGQGVLFAGELLAYAAMSAGKQTTWFPSYGPEMRGGTAHCMVVISDEEIGSPVFRFPQALLALNLPSLDRYEQRIRPGGVLIIDSSMVNRRSQREDLKTISLPATSIAESLGSKRAANVVMVGALCAALPILDWTLVEQGLVALSAKKHQEMLALNIEALRKGATFV